VNHAGVRATQAATRRPGKVLAYLLSQPTLTAAGGVLVLMLLVSVIGTLFWTASPTEVSLGDALLAPSASHPMGTDDLGRDMLARFFSGAKLSLLLGIAVTAAGALLGGTLGVLAGMAGRRTDGLMTWVINTLLAFPPLMLAMAVAVALGADLTSGAIGLVIAAVPWFARVLRSEVVRIRSLPSVEAAVVIGASRSRTAWRYVVPHLIPTLVIQAAASFGWAILTMAAHGFVGLGAQPPTAEWGSMITGGLQYALSGQWWIGVFPGLGLVVVVTAATVLADRARDLLDPRGVYARI
jgi:peptide/nickel transport system permease protein